MPKISSEPYFSSDLFSFLKDLERHNDRAWFEANKERFISSARDPMVRFISDFGPQLERIAPFLVADPSPVGGSLFRIYRDTRFSKDKRPYKTNIGAHFRHRAAESKSASVPGFYLHLQPGRSFAAAGIWHPDPIALGKIRKAIAEHPSDWKKVRSRMKSELEGDSLQNPPRGFDPAHPYIEDIKRKDFIVTKSLSDAQVKSPDFMKTYVEICREQLPLNEFLNTALGL